MSSPAGVLALNNWNAVVPVLLPLGEHTISSIGVASAAITVPFFFYILAMFSILVPIWMDNHKSDTARIVNEEEGTTQIFVAPRLMSAEGGGISLSISDQAEQVLSDGMGYPSERAWSSTARNLAQY